MHVHRSNRRRWLAVVSIALLACLALVSATGDARASGFPFNGPFGGGDGSGSPPKAPPSAIECMDAYLDGEARCYDIHCTYILWIPVSCNSVGLGNCLANVDEGYAVCLEQAAGE